MSRSSLLAALLLSSASAQLNCTGTSSVYSGSVKLITGAPFDLSGLTGNVTVFLNVASF